MTNTLKTIGILGIVAFGTLGTTGCVYREPGWGGRWHDRDRHERHEYREHRYGRADFAPAMRDGVAMTEAGMAAAPMTGVAGHDIAA